MRGMNILQKFWLEGGGYPFFTHRKNKRNMAENPFRAIPPAPIDAAFARFAPAALKSFRHPGRGGYPFLTETLRGGGVPKYIFYSHFSPKSHMTVVLVANQNQENLNNIRPPCRQELLIDNAQPSNLKWHHFAECPWLHRQIGCGGSGCSGKDSVCNRLMPMTARDWISPFDRTKICRGETTKCKSRANGQLGRVPRGSVGKHMKAWIPFVDGWNVTAGNFGMGYCQPHSRVRRFGRANLSG